MGGGLAFPLKGFSNLCLIMERKSIRVTNLFLDLDNFRFEHQNSQLDAINTMVDAYIDELYKLAVDILKIGLNPMDIPYVLPHPTEEKKYIVLEGNRRITTLKLLLNPNLIDPKHLNSGILYKNNALIKPPRERSLWLCR